MNLIKRKEKLEKMREKGMTLKEIGEESGLTMERVRQILNKTTLVCKKHLKQHDGVCLYCKTENVYEKKIKEMSEPELINEAWLLAIKDRSLEAILKRTAFIRLLRDDWKFTFTKIAEMLKRDKKSIRNLYYK